MNAIPVSIFESHAKWKYGNIDYAAACCRISIWPLLFLLGIALGVASYVAILIVVILVFLIIDDMCHRVCPTNCCADVGAEICCFCCCAASVVAADEYDTANYPEGRVPACNGKACKWGLSHLNCGCNGGGKLKSYSEYLLRGDQHYYSELQGLAPHGAGIYPHPGFFEKDTCGKKRNVICCWRRCSCLLHENCCPCCFTDWMSPQF